MAHKQFFASIAHLQEIQEWIDLILRPLELSSKEMFKVELITEEVVVNIVNHSYKGKPLPLDVEVMIHSKSEVKVQFKDRGPPFNPLDTNGADISSPLEEREIGGLGIFFIRQNANKLDYQRVDNENILTLTLLFQKE